MNIGLIIGAFVILYILAIGIEIYIGKKLKDKIKGDKVSDIPYLPYVKPPYYVFLHLKSSCLLVIKTRNPHIFVIDGDYENLGVL